jgi:hypothetical protein
MLTGELHGTFLPPRRPVIGHQQDPAHPIVAAVARRMAKKAARSGGTVKLEAVCGRELKGDLAPHLV